MKKSLLLILLALGITAFVNAQWTVYDASVLPTDATPAWAISDLNSGPGAIVAINPVTNTLKYSSTPTLRNAWKLNIPKPSKHEATWIIRARANTVIDTADWGMQFEINGDRRADLKIGRSPNGGFLKLSAESAETAIYPADSSLDISVYNIIRLTMDSAVFRVYLNEDATPVAEITSTRAAQDQFLRFGYFTSSGECEGFLNAMAFDTTGAYAPGAGAALPTEFVSDKGNIVVAVNPAIAVRELGTITFLEELGYEVDTMHIDNNNNLLVRGASALATLNAADLVMCGRSLQSSALDASRGQAIWNNKVTKPVMMLHPYGARNIGWFSVRTPTHANVVVGDTVWAKILVPADPIFANATLVGDSMDWTIMKDDFYGDDVNTNADIIARITSPKNYNNGILLARWPEGVKYYKTSTDPTLWGTAPRSYFGHGNDESNVVNYWNFTENAQYVFKAEVERLVNAVYTPYAGSSDATLSGLTVSEGTLTPAFAAGTHDYTLTLADWVSSITIAATPNESCAVAKGTGTFTIPVKGITDSVFAVTVISSDVSDTIKYNITLNVPGPLANIIFITPDTREDAAIKFLEKNGAGVTKFWAPKSIELVGQDTIDMLNAADLLIIGRSGGSGNFQSADQRATWNALTAPMILNCPWKARSNRLKWFNSTSANQTNEGTGYFNAKAVLPEDPSLDFVNLAADSSFRWSFLPDDWLQTSKLKPHNGQVVVQRNDTVPLVVRWNTNQEFYTETGVNNDTARGPRVYIGMGNDNYGGQAYPNHFPLSRDAEALYWAEVLRLAGLEAAAPSYYLDTVRTMKSLMVSKGTLAPAFHKDTMAYTVTLTSAELDTVEITGIASSSKGYVSGGGKVGIGAADTVKTALIYGRAENGTGLRYTITITKPKKITSVQESLADNCQIYPNPVNDKLTIKSDELITRVSVYNIQGSEVVTRIVNGYTIDLPVNELKAGIYFVKVQSGKNTIMSKIVKN
ncbi:MAG: T9SS type A sorting domain-containing protein [Bacteroidales bacterium]|nr:T9SS type A sorting domain-containing protein [Bacteroidales bacterium]